MKIKFKVLMSLLVLFTMTFASLANAQDRVTSNCGQITSMNGLWSGNYSYPDGKNAPQSMTLTFKNGKILGSGTDKEVGDFTIDGTYSDSGQIKFTKKYLSHTVNYAGKLTGGEMSGAWSIDPNQGNGNFSITHPCTSPLK